MDWIIEIVHGHEDWIILVLVIYAAFDRTGALQRFFANRRERQRKGESNTQSLIDHLQEEIELTRRRRQEDFADFHAENQKLRSVLLERDNAIRKKDEIILRLTRGESRIRHAAISWLVYIEALRDACRRRGFSPPPFGGWQDLLGLSSDLDERLRAAFDSDNKNLPPPES